jgi:hypothetical protein
VKRKHILFVLTLVLVLVLGSLGVAQAIVLGWPDEENHPYVGMMVADVDGEPAWRCSGTLIAPKVFLTAGHCVFGADAARVWFGANLTDVADYPGGGGPSIEGTPIAHPGFDGTLALPNTSDVGVVILKEPVNDLGFGELPGIGLADELNVPPGSQTMLNIVGYGKQSVKPEELAERIRYQATPMLVELDGAISAGWNIHLSSNLGQGGGTGGACSGDSGGPALTEVGSNVVVGVGSFVFNSNCRGVGYYYRVDTEYAQDFINRYLKP